MYKYGFVFLLSALSKLWLSIYITNYFLIRELEITGRIEGTIYSNINSLVIAVIIIEFMISLILFSISIFNKKNKWSEMAGFWALLEGDKSHAGYGSEKKTMYGDEKEPGLSF